MSIGDVVPVIFYEIAFLCSFLLLPVLAFRADVENYIFGVLVMYMCIRVVRNRKKTVLPADDKAVFISGCDSGFGHMVATRLDKKGYKVFAGCLFPDGEGAKSLNKTSSDKLQVLPLDVTSDESVKEAGVFVREHLGNSKLWAVINNAGIYGHGDVELCGVQTYMKIANVNMYGMVRVTQEFLPLIRQSQDARSLSYDISDECLLLAVVAFYWNAWYPVRVNINGLDLSDGCRELMPGQFVKLLVFLWAIINDLFSS